MSRSAAARRALSSAVRTCFRLGVQVLGILDMGVWVRGLGLKVLGSAFGVYGVGFDCGCLGLWVWG